MQSDGLKPLPCPFCGGPAGFEDGFCTVYCENAACDAQPIITEADIAGFRKMNREQVRKSVITAWNTRPAPVDVEVEVEALANALMSYTQGDMDGVMGLVSRQALHEAADKLRSLSTALEEARRPGDDNGLIAALERAAGPQMPDGHYDDGAQLYQAAAARLTALEAERDRYKEALALAQPHVVAAVADRIKGAEKALAAIRTAKGE